MSDKSKKEEFISWLLNFQENNDNISPTEISEILQKMNRKNEIKQKYSIKERKDGKQFYVYVNRKQITATTYEGLIDKLYEIEYGIFNSSLDTLYPIWLKWKRDSGKVSSKTLREYTFLWNKYLKNQEICHTPIHKLHPKDFTLLFRKWTKGRQMTKKTFVNIKSLLNGILKYSINELEILDTNPLREIDCSQFTFKPVNNSHDVFSIEDRTKLLEHLKQRESDIYALGVSLSFHTVLRIGELLALRWNDIEGNFIHIQNQRILDITMDDDITFSPRKYKNVNILKGNSDEGYRYEPITPECKIILEQIRRLNPDGEYILMKDGKQLNGNTFNRHLRKYALEIGITPRTSHKIRFCVASMLYAKGMPLADLQQLLGHTTTAMTLSYIRSVIPQDDTVSLMSSILG